MRTARGSGPGFSAARSPSALSPPRAASRAPLPSVRAVSCDRRVRPLGGAALVAARHRAPRAQVTQQLGHVARRRGLREGPSDVHARVVVAAADPDAVARVHVDRGRSIELAGPSAVADLPDREQVGQAAAVACGQRGGHGVIRVGQGADDLALVHVEGARFDIAAVALQPLVVFGRDPVAEHVHRLGLAAEVGRELLRDEDVGALGDPQDPLDGVVVGDRHEVHAAALGEFVDLLGRGRALGQTHRALHAQARDLRGGGVTVQVGPCHRLCPARFAIRTHRIHIEKIRLQSGGFCNEAGIIL